MRLYRLAIASSPTRNKGKRGQDLLQLNLGKKYELATLKWRGERRWKFNSHSREIETTKGGEIGSILKTNLSLKKDRKRVCGR